MKEYNEIVGKLRAEKARTSDPSMLRTLESLASRRDMFKSERLQGYNGLMNTHLARGMTLDMILALFCMGFFFLNRVGI